MKPTFLKSTLAGDKDFGREFAALAAGNQTHLDPQTTEIIYERFKVLFG
jgi:hypothetical protein